MPTTTGGGPFEVAYVQRKLPQYLDLVADIGFTRIECGEGFTDISLNAREIVKMANDHGLEVQFELGRKHTEHSLKILSKHLSTKEGDGLVRVPFN